jgi:hypothetical protein
LRRAKRVGNKHGLLTTAFFISHLLPHSVECENQMLPGRATALRRLFHEEKQIIDFGLDSPRVGRRIGAGKLYEVST